MCIFSGAPLTENEKKGKYGKQYGGFEGEEKFQFSLCQIPCSKHIGCCCVTILCFCPAQIYLRKKALNHVEPGSGWKNYKCCQGYFGGCCCLQPGKCGEQACPCPCMCLESCCCPGLAVQSSSMVIRERYNLGLDKDDIRLIRCTNCLQILACCCYIAACVTDIDAVDIAARVVGCVADAVFCSVAGCMTAQCNHEINYRTVEPSAPQTQTMEGRNDGTVEVVTE